MRVSQSFCLSRTRLGSGVRAPVGFGRAVRRGARWALASACLLVAAGCSSSSTTVTSPTSARCPVTLTLAPATTEAGGGSGQVTVSVNRECTWEARSESEWITLAAPTSGQGEGSLRYTAAANALVSPRRGAVLVNEARIEIPQSAAACRFDLSAAGGSAGPEGGSLAVSVGAQATCQWTAVSQVDWVQVVSGSEGNGQGVVSMSVAPNPGAARQGTVMIAGQRYAVSQAAQAPAQPACSFGVTPPSEAFESSGGDGTIRVAASANNCAWTAASSVPWITVSTPGGSGTATVRYSVAANPGEARAGAVVAAGTAVTITQSAATIAPSCELTVSPQSDSVPAGGGDGTVRISASGSSCTWTAVSNVPWITLSTGSGSGSGSVRYSAAANSGAARTGTLTVARSTITVSQPAAPAVPACELEVSPLSESLPADGGERRVRVGASRADCAWTAVSHAPWITLAHGGSSGNGEVRYAVAANTGPARTGTMTVARATVTVRQEAAPLCEFDVSPLAESLPATGGDGRIRVETSEPDCNWTAASNAPWITLVNGGGNGNGELRYVVAPNLGPARTGTLTVAGVMVTVTQAALSVPSPISLRGDISDFSGDCPNLSFTVDQRRVRTSGATVFDGRCNQLSNGRRVSVQGLAQGDGSVLALRVEREGGNH